MNKIKQFFIDFYNKTKNECLCTFIGFLVGAMIAFMLTNSVWESRIARHEKEVRLENVRHFIEHPSMYKLDTLYRKSNDTLFIYTINVNYK